jgi:hypothetical protein
MSATPRIGDGVARLRSVFLETPGAQLSVGDASQLSGLEWHTCRIVLEALEDARFLIRGPNGLFVRGTYAPPASRHAGQ